MAKFVYKMQNLLDIKYKLEAQAKSDYAAAAAKLAEEEEKLAALYLKKRSYESHGKELLMDRINVLELKANKDAINAIKSMIRTQSLEVHVAQKNLEAQRLRLSEIMVDRKTYEKLKENKFQEFLQELRAEESKEVDQLVSFNFNNQ